VTMRELNGHALTYSCVDASAPPRHPTRSGNAEAYADLRRRRNWTEKLQSLESLDYEVIDNKRFKYCFDPLFVPFASCFPLFPHTRETAMYETRVLT